MSRDSIANSSRRLTGSPHHTASSDPLSSQPLASTRRRPTPWLPSSVSWKVLRPCAHVLLLPGVASKFKMNERHPPVLASDPRGETLELETEEMSDSSSSGHEEENLASGEVLAARYVLRAELGRGANSRVFRAYDLVTKTEIAIKVLTGPGAGSSESQQRLGRELRLARQRRHLHVCDVYDFTEGDGYRFLTMALATRGTLRHSLEKTP